MVQVALNPDCSENVAYIIPQFPIYISHGLLSRYPNYRAISHWHEDLEFIYIQSGHMRYQVNGEVVLLGPGEGIVVNSRNLHYGYSDDREECEFLCILIHPDLFSANVYVREHDVLPLTENTHLPFIHLQQEAWHTAINELIIRIAALEQTSPHFYVDCQSLVMQLFQQLHKHTKKSPEQQLTAADQTLTRLRHMVHYIHQHYDSPITLDEIASAGAMGKTACCAAFRTYMHSAPIEYLIHYRLAQSVQLLQNTDMPITQIAHAVGFHDSSYFTKHFRQYYGKTPRQLR